MNAAEVFAESLVDLASQNPAFAGIHTPQSAVGAAKVGVTEQFLERADEYHRNYLDLDYWRFLLGNALKALGAMPDPKIVIDIGSGSGNSVIPLADRFPDASIVATDISPQLLAILRDFLRRRADSERFALVCVDATKAAFRASVADLAVGAAILHHVLDPARVIESCFRALKPGGWAIFFEPFEAGNTILKLTYQRILAQASTAEKGTAAMQFLGRMVTDYTIRQRPKSDPIFRELDDKWLFTRTYFERVKAEQGWSELITYGLNVCATPLRNQAVVQLKLGLQASPDVLPEWAWTVIDEMDAGISDDLKQEWVQEGAALFRKPLRS
ncbi:MAG: class I SAM-dependent methyltransferase [Betaproteobacteria bacterium]|nr:MAG: class I SAM-dependent methyltransferase [Betaproteobacteria bacterium]